jgi:hypothetical protein
MEQLYNNFGYAIVWKNESQKDYGVNHYKRVIIEYPFFDEQEEEYTILAIFSTRKLANDFMKGNIDWEIIKVKITK